MRWPFRRRAVPAPVLPRGPVAPLTTVSGRFRPAVTGIGLPEVAGTRALLARPPIVPDPSSPRGRLYGTAVTRQLAPTARRRLPSLRHLFAGPPSAPADTPRPWAVRVIDRPTEPVPEPPLFEPPLFEPSPFEPSADAGWPEPQPVPEQMPFDPFGSPEPSDEDWMTADAIADLQAVLAAAQGAPAPTVRTPPPPVSQPIRRLTLAESRRRGITSAQPPPSADDSIAEPQTVEDPPALDPVQPDPVRPASTNPEPPASTDIEPPMRSDPVPPARGRVTRLIGRPAPDWSLADVPAPTSGTEQSAAGRDLLASGPLMPGGEESAVGGDTLASGQFMSGAGQSAVGGDLLASGPLMSGGGQPAVGRDLLASGQFVSGGEQLAVGGDALASGQFVHGAGRSVVGGDALALGQVVSGGEQSAVDGDALASGQFMSGAGQSAVGRDLSASESGAEEPAFDGDPLASEQSLADADQSTTGHGPLPREQSVAGAAQSAAGHGPLVPDRSVSDVGRPVVGRGSSVPGRSVPVAGAARSVTGRGSLAAGRSVSDAQWPAAGSLAPQRSSSTPGVERSVAGRDSLAPERSVSGVEASVAGHGPSAPGPVGVERSAGRGSSLPERSGLERPAGERDQPVPANDYPSPMLAGRDHSLPHEIDQAAGAAGLDPDVAFGPPGPARLGLGQPLPPGVTRLTTPPADLAAAVKASYGVDVSGTPIHRGPAATKRAAALSAKAFTERGEVFLPDQLGPLTTPPARAGLAHELTHVAQQRILGVDLPAEWTPSGQALEQHAVAVERHVRNGQQNPPAPPPIPAAPDMSTSDSIQRQPDHDGPILSWTAPTPPDEPPAPPRDELAGYSERLVALCGQRLANLDNPTDLDELAEKIYHRLRDMVRGELLVDRERAGLLTDFR